MGNRKSTTLPNLGPWGHGTTGETVLEGRDLSGQHFVVTGCNTGIGKETARVLYNAGARVTMACRTESRMMVAKEEIESQLSGGDGGGGTLSTLLVDLSRLSSVRAAVDAYVSTSAPNTSDADEVDEEQEEKATRSIDVLILNAAAMSGPSKVLTEEDGFELTMATNHFGHFAFALLLLPFVRRRIVVVSSGAHRAVKTFPIDDLDFEKKFHWGRAYTVSKLANILFVRELQRRLRLSPSPFSSIECFALHPGGIPTELGRNHRSCLADFCQCLCSACAKSVQSGCSTTVAAAVAEKLDGFGGSYLSDCQLCGPSKVAQDGDLARNLFEISEERTGVRFPFEMIGAGGVSSENGQEQEEEEEVGVVEIEIDVEEDGEILAEQEGEG